MWLEIFLVKAKIIVGANPDFVHNLPKAYPGFPQNPAKATGEDASKSWAKNFAWNVKNEDNNNDGGLLFRRQERAEWLIMESLARARHEGARRKGKDIALWIDQVKA